MLLNYLEVIIKIASLGLVIAAAGLWAGAGNSMRPKHRDEQTLIGGTIWSQLIIPIGIMISKLVEENMDLSIEGYYLLSGILLLWITGLVLIVHETRTYKRRQQRLHETSSVSIAQNKRTTSQQTTASMSYDKVYYGIGVICLLAGAVKMSEFVVFVVLADDLD